MPIDGPTVYRALRRELEIAQDEVDRQRAEAAAHEEKMRRLAADRAEALMALARFSLPEISRGAIERTLSGARDELLGLLAEKERREAGLRSRRKQAGEAVARLEARIDGLTDRLNALVADRERLEAVVADRLKADPEFKQRSELAAKAEDDLHRDEARVAQLKAEAEAKLPAYRGSALFRYLVDRGYGTPEYAHRGLSRRLDRWVARLIDFPRAKLGYDFLTRTPALVEAEVASRRQVFEDLMGQVEAIEREAETEAGLTAVLEEGERTGAERDGAVAALDKERGGSADLDREIAALSLPDNDFYRRAVERLQGVLARTESAALAERARQTPEPQDDALVGRVRTAEAESARLGAELARLAARRQVADRYFAGLQDLVGRFRSSNFDSARSVFADRLDLAPVLEGLRRGEMSAGDAWGLVQKAQQFRPHQVGVSGGGGGGSVFDVLNSPESRILIEVFGSALGGALQEAGRRGVGRRSSGGFGGGGGWSVNLPSAPARSSPVRSSSSSRPASRPATRNGGFSTTDGF